MTGTKKILALLLAVLLGGVVFVWQSLFGQFAHFDALYGTIFMVHGNTIPNPFLTPCFLGSLGYLVALFWAAHLFQTPSVKSARYLRNALIFFSIFGLSVISYETAQYFKLIGGVSVSCTPGAAPWATPCVGGTIGFITALVLSAIATKRLAAVNPSLP